jgi:hypothetical protein
MVLRRMSLLKDLQKEQGENHRKKLEKNKLRGKKCKEANPPLKCPLEGIPKHISSLGQILNSEHVSTRKKDNLLQDPPKTDF